MCVNDIIRELIKFGGAGLLFAAIFLTALAYLAYDIWAEWRYRKSQYSEIPYTGTANAFPLEKAAKSARYGKKARHKGRRKAKSRR